MNFPHMLTADLHFTGNPQDEYRWDLVPWLVNQGHKLRKLGPVPELAILGDLTDAKDFHAAPLVNRVVAALVALRAVYGRVRVLQGNHDYLQAGHPFFQFVEYLPGVEFISTPKDTEGHARALWLPHTKTPTKDWADWDLGEYDFAFIHQTAGGSVASNGQQMEGEALPRLYGPGKVWSGDIHVPQVVGAVEYVGSPYHVHFGDKFVPRCVLLTGTGAVNALTLHHPNISRFTLDVKDERAVHAAELQAGDQVKVRVHLEHAAVREWPTVRRAVEEAVAARGAHLCGLKLVLPERTQRVRVGQAQRTGRTAEQTVTEFVQREEWGADALDVGLELLG